MSNVSATPSNSTPTLATAPTGLLVVLALLTVASGLRYLRSASERRPPGPAGLPLLGNVHQLPVDYQWHKMAEWGRDYGDLVWARFFRTPTLIVNSKAVAIDLMEKRSARYSDRPPFILLKELLGWEKVLNNLHYGDSFRKHRKWLQNAFVSKEALASYQPIQRRETYTLLLGLCESPELFMDHVKRWAAAMVLEISYGVRVHSLGDELVVIAERATVETIMAGSPGSMIVDFFPILRYLPMWMPGSGFKHRAARAKVFIRKTLDVPFAMVQEAMKEGTAKPSFTASLLEEAAAQGILTPEHEEDIKSAAGVIYAAGSDTTTTAMRTFMLAMVLHQDVYKKAQAEIDRVVGAGRLPDFEDREQLPYLESVIMEVFRWNAPVPLHR